jgi:hypothetical protein
MNKYIKRSSEKEKSGQSGVFFFFPNKQQPHHKLKHFHKKEKLLFSKLKVFLILMNRAYGINKSPKMPNSFKEEKEYTLS